MRARALAPVVLACACLPAACGTERTELPDPNAAPTGSVQRLAFPKAGISLELRRPLQVTRRPAPEVFRFAMPSGALVTAFAYSRSEPVPRGRAQLRDARSRLLAATRRRDPRFDLEAARVVTIAGVQGVEVTGTQSLSGGRLDTRSVHLFKGSAEYVFELIAARKDFAKADRTVFSPMLKTVRLTGRVRT